MMRYTIRLDEDAKADLRGIYTFIRKNGGSAATARGYINRLLGFLSGFDIFPHRGSLREHIRPGLRIVGFERRISVAFIVEDNEVVILRLLYGGQQFESE
jgi:toxin ParE1/3/4